MSDIGASTTEDERNRQDLPAHRHFSGFLLLAGIKDESNRPGVNKKNYCRTSLRKKRRESRRDIVFHSPGLPPR